MTTHESSSQESTNNRAHVLKLTLIRDEHYKALLYELASAGVALPAVVDRVRQDYITAAMRIENGNRIRAAARIGVHRNTMARRAGKDVEE